MYEGTPGDHTYAVSGDILDGVIIALSPSIV